MKLDNLFNPFGVFGALVDILMHISHAALAATGPS